MLYVYYCFIVLQKMLNHLIFDGLSMPNKKGYLVNSIAQKFLLRKAILMKYILWNTRHINKTESDDQSSDFTLIGWG